MTFSRRDFLRAGALTAAGTAFTGPGRSALAADAAPTKLPIGMNLAGIADWEPGFPFLNLVWGARLWLTRNATRGGPWNTGHLDAIPLDENGYPRELPFAVPGVAEPQIVFTLLPNVRAPGEYVALYDGEGEVEAMAHTRIVSAAPGRVVLAMQHRGGEAHEALAIRRSARGNPVCNLRVVPLAHERDDLEQRPFLPEFLDFCRPWHCLRFMDWAATNGSLEREWNQRKRPSFYTMAGESGDAAGLWDAPPSGARTRLSGGVAIEVMLRLANTLNVDPWFCVPHRATDEYISGFARLVKARLDPRRKVFVEYSNEVWNWQFPQAHWMLRSRRAAEALAARGVPAWKAAGGPPPEFALDGGEIAREAGDRHPERIGALARRVFRLWEAEWTGADRARLVRVCAVQTGWLDTAERTLRWCVENGGADALAGTGYFGADDAVYRRWAERGAALSVAEVLADADAAITQGERAWRELAALARKHRVACLTYEGGQHLQPHEQKEHPYAPALAAAQTHPRMEELYRRVLAVHAEMGCELFSAFSSVGRQGTRWGSWGHLARYGQPLAEAPKLRALLAANTPRNS